MIGANNVISTKRLVEASNKESYPAGNKLENIDCYIEYVQPEIATMYDDRYTFNMFRLLIDDAVDLAIGDEVTDQNAVTYTVKGVQKYEGNTDTGDTTEAIMVKKYAKTND